jgi:D-galacturonate reductase
MMHRGETVVDQAHRGYGFAQDGSNFASPNPLFMKYTPDDRGCFAGQQAYGYRSFEAFISAVQQVRAGAAAARDFDHSLASIHATSLSTAILEAGRRSLDAGGAAMEIVYESDTSCEPVDIRRAAD